MENGHFVKGAWIEGDPKRKIVNGMVRKEPCLCHGSYSDYLDYSYSLKGLYGPQNPTYEYVIFYGMNTDGSMIIEWNPEVFPEVLSTLEPYWNDGKWIEYTGE